MSSSSTRYLPSQLFENNGSSVERNPMIPIWNPTKIIEAQLEAWYQALEKILVNRSVQETEENQIIREKLIQRHLEEYFLPPLDENGLFLAEAHASLYEILENILDLDAEFSNLPDKDERIKFISSRLEKRFAILSWIKTRIIASLPKGEELTDRQISAMFNNISQKQMQALKRVLVNCSLAIHTQTSGEKWRQKIDEAQKQVEKSKTDIPPQIIEALNQPNTALLISDVQEIYLMGYFGNLDIFVKKIIALIDYCYNHNVPVFFIGKDIESHFREFLDGIREKIKDRDSQVVDKQLDDAFEDTNLQELLEKNRIKSILLVGLNIDGCIYLTAKSAVKAGFGATATNHASFINSRTNYEYVLELFKRLGIRFIDVHKR